MKKLLKIQFQKKLRNYDRALEKSVIDLLLNETHE